MEVATNMKWYLFEKNEEYMQTSGVSICVTTTLASDNYV